MGYYRNEEKDLILEKKQSLLHEDEENGEEKVQIKMVPVGEPGGNDMFRAA